MCRTTVPVQTTLTSGWDKEIARTAVPQLWRWKDNLTEPSLQQHNEIIVERHKTEVEILQNYRYIIECNVGEKHRWSRIVRYVDRFHKIHYIEWKNTGWIHTVRVENDKKTNDLQAKHFVARDLERCPMRRNAKRSEGGRSRNQSTTMPEECVVFTT